MSHQIKFNGRYISPERSAGEMLPLDTMLVCSECESPKVVSGEAKASTRFPSEHSAEVPRQQDRRCLECGHLWTSVLAPLSLQPNHPLIIPAYR